MGIGPHLICLGSSTYPTRLSRGHSPKLMETGGFCPSPTGSKSELNWRLMPILIHDPHSPCLLHRRVRVPAHTRASEYIRAGLAHQYTHAHAHAVNQRTHLTPMTVEVTPIGERTMSPTLTPVPAIASSSTSSCPPFFCGTQAGVHAQSCAGTSCKRLSAVGCVLSKLHARSNAHPCPSS